MAVSQLDRARRAWPILAHVAAQRTTITYGRLGAALDVHHRAIRYVLSVIQDYCMEELLPPLTILVVNQSGRPGAGFIAHDHNDLEAGFEKVWKSDWAKLRNPFEFVESGETIQSLVATLAREPEEAEAVYVRVRSRGVGQLLFREALLQVYKKQCAFTGFGFTEALEACHIVPWAEASGAERLDVRNGILLNSLHHRLFDAGIMTLDEGRRIRYRSSKNNRAGSTGFERAMVTDLDGQLMRLPRLKNRQPLAQYIRRHNELVRCNG